MGNESQKLVWITLINKGYIDFTKHFLMSIKNQCITDLNWSFIVLMMNPLILSMTMNCVFVLE